MALWLGFFTPKGTPRAILKRLEGDLLQVAQSADTKEQMGRQGLEAQGAGAAELAKLVRADGENYRKVFKAAGIPMQ
jgi:tripartite-type tricarboxylate transporter receptor subunit TctC